MRPDRPSEGARVEVAPAGRYRFQVAPDFTAKLKNKRVPEGTTVHLNCSVTGIPEPQIKWLKDGQEVFEGTEYSMRVSQAPRRDFAPIFWSCLVKP